MMDQRDMFRFLAASTPEECRELGKLFMSMADAPRDVHWKAGFAEKLAMIPETPETSLAMQIAAGRARVAAENDELWATGWHPQTMRAELEARDYGGTSPPDPAVQ